MLRNLCLFFAVVALACASPTHDLVSMGKADECAFHGTCKHHDWALFSSSKVLGVSLVFSIKQLTTEADCTSLLLKVSTPNSPQYGNHLTFEEVGKMFGNKNSAQSVKNWLLSQGVKESQITTTPHGEYLTVRVSQNVAEKLLSTKFQQFYSKSLNTMIARSREYYLPRSVAQHVQFVANAVSFPQTFNPRLPPVRIASVAAEGNTTPDVVLSFYKVVNYTSTNVKNSQSVFESLNQAYSEDDLALFQQKYKITRQKVTKVIGPNNSGQCSSDLNDCAEASLDVQYMMAISRNVNFTFWSVANEEDIFTRWATAVAADSSPPLVHSISYGGPEALNDQGAIKAFNLEMCKLGLRGITVVVSSGDDGVANYIARQDPSSCGFSPSYPASCPYVTAVGATQGPEAGQPEIACASDTNGLITTGGGFSIAWSAPAWQNTSINHYYQVAKATLPPAGQWNTKGRGYPDVAIMGHNYEVAIGGQFYQVSGTSASAPVFAALVSLVNDARLNAGKKSLGFLNPALYSLKAEAFNDITKGKNNCCAGQPGTQVCCKYGFAAAAGWDPLTGLGTINYPVFKQALLAL